MKLGAITAAVVAFTLLLASYHGVPIVLLILGVLLVGFGYVMRNSILGRHTYAIGGNEAAARLSGVKSKRVVFLAFVNMGVLAALAGMVFAARLNAGTPQAASTSSWRRSPPPSSAAPPRAAVWEPSSVHSPAVWCSAC